MRRPPDFSLESTFKFFACIESNSHLILNYMVKSSNTELDTVFAALSDSTRRAILERLAKGEVAVSELAEPFDMSLPAVWKHLQVLEKAGLVTCEKNGRVKRCTLDASPMKKASEWIDHYRIFWERRFDALSEYLKQEMKKENRK